MNPITKILQKIRDKKKMKQLKKEVGDLPNQVMQSVKEEPTEAEQIYEEQEE